MKFEWDPAKAAVNIRKHDVSFEEAARAFEDSLSATFPDPDHSHDEFRLITYGLGPKGEIAGRFAYGARRYDSYH